MIRSISIIALAALFSLLSGCGCSRGKKPVDAMKERMRDSAYTNMLAQALSDQKKIASEAAKIRSSIEKLGKNAVGSPEYVDLTNRLARCEKEAETTRTAARMAVRDRLMKDSKAKKGNLKK
jgi:hypothetical protein